MSTSASEPPTLSFGRSSDLPGWETISVGGEVDLATAGQLDDALTDAIGSGRHLLIDLGPTDFMDSTGLRSLVRAHRELAESGRELAILALPGPISRLLDVSGIATTIRVVGDASELA